MLNFRQLFIKLSSTFEPIAGVDMTKADLAFRGHLLKRPPVEKEGSLSGQPSSHDRTSLGIGGRHVVVLTAGVLQL